MRVAITLNSIKSRLLLMTGVCVFGMVMLVFSQHYFNEQQLVLNKQRDTLLRLSRDILQLRRHEKDFLLRGHINYVDKFSKGVDTFKQDIESLHPLFITYGSHLTEAEELTRALLRYQLLFERVVSTQRQLGLDNYSGLRAVFDEQIMALKDIQLNGEVERILVSIQLAQRDMLLNNDPDLSVEVHELVASLPTEFVRQQSVSEHIKSMSSAVAKMSLNMQEMGETETEGLRGEYRRQAHIVEMQLTAIDDKLQPIIADQVLRMRMYNFLIALATCGLLITMLYKSFSTFHSAFSYFMLFFYQCKREYQHIDPKKLGFSEFKALAELANQMVEARKDAEQQLIEAKRQLKELRENKS